MNNDFMNRLVEELEGKEDGNLSISGSDSESEVQPTTYAVSQIRKVKVIKNPFL